MANTNDTTGPGRHLRAVTTPPAPSIDQKIIAELRRPFAPGDVQFKVASDQRIVSYVEARTIMGRLNAVCPDQWHETYSPVPPEMLRMGTHPKLGPMPMRLSRKGEFQGWDPNLYWLCHLTVAGVTHTDVGEGMDPKAVRSDALKRAATGFGIGECLYSFKIPPLPKAGEAPSRQITRLRAAIAEISGESTTWDMVARYNDRRQFTAGTIQGLRLLYAVWLGRVGTEAYGQYLAHSPSTDPEFPDHDTDVAPEAGVGDGHQGSDPDPDLAPRARINLDPEPAPAPTTAQAATTAHGGEPGSVKEAARLVDSGQLARRPEVLVGLIQLLAGQDHDPRVPLATLGKGLPVETRQVLIKTLVMIGGLGWTTPHLEAVIERAYGHPGITARERASRFITHLGTDAKATASRAAS